jgi:hypothetical protein
MAKGILEFDLNDTNDSMAHLRAVKSTDMAIVLHDLSYNIHRRIEREIEARELKGEGVTQFDVIQMYKESIAELFEEQGINIDQLIN